MNYTEAKECLGKRESKKIALNTTLRFDVDEDCFIIKYWSTDIIKIFKNAYEINTGGWNTYSTFKRLNEFTPYSFRILKGDTYCDTKIFINKIRIEVQ